MTWVVGIDIGGTFTDLSAAELSTGRRIILKTPTTPSDPLDGVLRALELARAEPGFALGEIALLVHATTLATNTLIERTGSRVAMLTTKGFRDIIETGSEDRYDLYDLGIQRPAPLVPRELRFAVEERMDAAGAVVRELDAAWLEHTIADLRAAQVEGVAVALLHSYANPAHEEQVAGAVTSAVPGMPVSLSSDVAPIIREYPRFLATVINVYVGEKVASYLGRLTALLSPPTFTGRIGIMKSDGGMCEPEEAIRYPVRLLESGPAAGVLAAAEIARRCDVPRAIAFDMGGTTAKACLVMNGEPSITDEIEVSRLERFKNGSGLPLRLPSVDLIEVGAGGGSIASVGPLGLLAVGPNSSGAEPGPASYGRGGTEATVTDADLILGYLSPDTFGSGIELDWEAAAEAIERVGERLGLTSVEEAAWAIHDVVNENMARAVRVHCVEHGIDPSTVTIIATGGAAPVHAANLLAKLNAPEIICPPDPGVASATGLLVAPRIASRTVTSVSLLGDLTTADLRRRFEAYANELAAASANSSRGGVPRYILHARLQGQAYELRLEVPLEVFDRPGQADVALGDPFRLGYEATFGRPPSQGKIEVVSWTVELREDGAGLPERPDDGRGAAAAAAQGERSIYVGDRWWDATVHTRETLAAHGPVRGPAVLHDTTSTTVVGPNQVARLDPDGNVRIVWEARG